MKGSRNIKLSQDNVKAFSSETTNQLLLLLFLLEIVMVDVAIKLMPKISGTTTVSGKLETKYT